MVDEAVIKVSGGTGGSGCVSFRREKYVPFGGPNGGSGGSGGGVYFEASPHRSSLLDFKYRPKYEAKRGEHGLGSDCDGRGGPDLIIPVPPGTLIFDNLTGEELADLKLSGEKTLIAHGGRGGRGNMCFKTSTNRAPRNHEDGEKGEQRELRLELRLLADVGLLGLPNAGKSTFLSKISRAHPKIAAYPFTTLEPNLGVLNHQDHSVIVADLPGLVEGASEGVGLGDRFLKHVSRNRILLHLVEILPEVDEISKNIKTIRQEVNAFDPDLLQKKEECLVFTKIDCLEPEALEEKKRLLKKKKLTGFSVSSQSGAGIKELLDWLVTRL